MKKRLLIVNDKMEIGGNSAALISLLNAIDKEKYDIDLLLYKNLGELLEEIPEGVQLLPQAARFQGRFGFFVRVILLIVTGYGARALWANRKIGMRGFSKQVMWNFQTYVLSRELKDEYDCAISFFEGWADRYVAEKVHAHKKIGWLHSMFRKIAPIPTLENEWMGNIDYIACVSEECRRDFVKEMPEFAEKAVMIENVRDSAKIRQLSVTEPQADEIYEKFKNAGSTKIVTVCRLSVETKGLDRAVQCAANLKAKGYHFLWCIVGDGEDRESIQKLIREKDVLDCFILAGSRVNPYPFIKCSDIMCLPSRWEGKPLAVYESMILSVPVVVTEYLSAHEQIAEKREGIIVPNDENSIESIEYALAHLMEHPEELEDMKQFLSEHEYGDLTPRDKIDALLCS